MKTTIQKLAFGTAVAVLAGPLVTGVAANAGDYNGGAYGGGLKDMRGSYVPVPAPSPIPEYQPKWYFRADVGVGMNLGIGASESGMTYGVNDLDQYDAIGGPFGTTGNLGGGEDIGHIYGAGIGYYFSPNFRIDLTADIRAEKKGDRSGSFSYTPDPDTSTNVAIGDEVRGTYQDAITMRSSLFMANAYYDMNRAGRWNPYLGAGLGFSVNQLQRTHRTDVVLCRLPADADCEAPIDRGSYGTDSGAKDYSFSLAASLMAGVTYRISKRTALDFNYRYLYVGGTSAAATVTTGYTANAVTHNSKISIDDQHEHYLRAGLRWDIN